MGQLIDGQWHTGWYDPDAQGKFRRPATRFRDWVKSDGSTRFSPEPGRYHLYVSTACPWATRIIIARSWYRLEEAIPMTVVSPKMGDDGWVFGGYPRADRDPLFDAPFLRDIYLRADARYTGRVTVPVLFDTREKTIVNNESREVLRMVGTDLAQLGDASRSLCPPARRGEIDAVLDAIYEPVNNGVYRCGFAGSQQAYDEACRELFSALDHWEQVLGRQRYLVGEAITEADVCMFTTLVRFDLVYYAHFKCNLRRVQDYPNLWNYLKELYQLPEFRAATDLEHIKVHYYWSQPTVNPTRIVPLGPTIPLDEPHDRARLG